MVSHNPVSYMRVLAVLKREFYIYIQNLLAHPNDGLNGK